MTKGGECAATEVAAGAVQRATDCGRIVQVAGDDSGLDLATNLYPALRRPALVVFHDMDGMGLRTGADQFPAELVDLNNTGFKKGRGRMFRFWNWLCGKRIDSEEVPRLIGWENDSPEQQKLRAAILNAAVRRWPAPDNAERRIVMTSEQGMFCASVEIGVCDGPYGGLQDARLRGYGTDVDSTLKELLRTISVEAYAELTGEAVRRPVSPAPPPVRQERA